MLASLRPEQVPVAEQLLRGGLHAVRQAIDAQNAAAKTSGKPPVSSDGLLAMADELLPSVRLAEWKDRAAVAQAAGKDYRLRELRAVVTSSRTVNLDEEGRTMAKALQESLDQRSAALREEWLARITNALNDGRVQQALEASVRPPEPGTRCPAELAVRLAEAAGQAMTAELRARGVDASARHGRRLTGSADGEARGHPSRRGGPAGGPPRLGFRSGAGQAARAAHPAPSPTPGGRAPVQPNRRLRVRSRALNPAPSSRCLVDLSPGRAMASTSTQPRVSHQDSAAASSASPTPTPRPIGLHVAALHEAPGDGVGESRPGGDRNQADQGAVELPGEDLGLLARWPEPSTGAAVPRVWRR